jgi:hypothetical protein
MLQISDSLGVVGFEGLDVLDSLRLNVIRVHTRLEHKLDEFLEFDVLSGECVTTTVSASSSSSRRFSLSSLAVDSLGKSD